MFKLRKKHEHTPVELLGTNLARAHRKEGWSFHWRCVCGKMIDDDTGQEVEDE